MSFFFSKFEKSIFKQNLMKRIILLFALLNQITFAQNQVKNYPPNEKKEYFDVVQKATFKYFWDFAHPISGLIPERTATPNIVTSGGTGMGVMAIIVGINQGWITKQQGLDRIMKTSKFLQKSERFHGAWSHWLDGNTGKVVPFSKYDDGGDIVETAYLINGLLIAREYFDGKTPKEIELRNLINQLWHSVEWNWYVKDGKLLWHWSKNHGWKMNHGIGGYNECLITYILAAGSPTFPITKEVYENTWKNHEPSHYINGKDFLGYKLPLGFDFGGPLFFSHYSYLSCDPRKMQDDVTNYWKLNQIHTLINRAYCLEKAPKEFGYHEENWGLTASDNHNFYGAHQPTEDNGTITPSAALSSFPYTPFYSMQALMHLYRREGNRLFGEYGFFDAYNKSKDWYSNQYLAIDQAPIVIMMENYRNGLIWKLGDKIQEVQNANAKLGLNLVKSNSIFSLYTPDAKTGKVDLMRHVDENLYHLDFVLTENQLITIKLTGQNVEENRLLRQHIQKGFFRFFFDADYGEYELIVNNESLKVFLR
jgi:hypothetical protein